MKKQNIAVIAAAVALAASVTTSQASLNFYGLGNMVFNTSPSDSFTLSPVSGSSSTPQFGFIGADSSLVGWVSGGPFTVNMGTLVSSDAGAIQTASVTSGGTLNIWDGTQDLTGTVNWIQIQTDTAVGQGGVADSLAINLSNISYSGSNGDLLALKNSKGGNINMTFQFSGSDPSLTTLFTSPGGTTASYSGSISAVPEPSTVVAGFLLLLPFGVSTLRILRKNTAA
jgi:hypothetical protein